MKEKNTPSLSSYFMSLLPDMERRKLMLDLTHTYVELGQYVQPMYDLDVRMVGRGKAVGRVWGEVKRGHKGRSGDLFNTVRKAIEVILKQEEGTMDMIEKTFGDKVLKSVIDYRGLNMLRYSEALSFFVEYTRRLIQVMVLEEFDGEDQHYLITPLDRGYTDYVTNPRNIQSFVTTLNVLTMDTKRFMKSLDVLDGHVFNPDADDALRTTNGRKTDPHGFGLMPVNWKPIYHIGMAWNAYQETRRERNKEELQKVQLTLLALKQRKEGKMDKDAAAKVEKQIKYYSNRANVLTGKIEDMEEGE